MMLVGVAKVDLIYICKCISWIKYLGWMLLQLVFILITSFDIQLLDDTIAELGT